MLLGMIADAERPRAALALLWIPIAVAVVAGSGDHSACESDQPAVTTEPARSYLLPRNYEVPELIGTPPGPRGIQVGLDGRLFAVLTYTTTYSLHEQGIDVQHQQFAIDDPIAASRFAHHDSFDRLPFCRGHDHRCGSHFVAELVLVSGPHRHARWLPSYDAEIRRVVAAPDLRIARAMLPGIAVRGLPGPDLRDQFTRRCQSIRPDERTQ